MKLVTILIIFLCLLSAGCSTYSCSSTTTEQVNAYNEYLGIREREFAEYKVKLSNWESEKLRRESERVAEIQKCDTDPDEYFRKTTPKGSSFDIDYYKSKAEIFKISLCESIVGPKDEMIFQKPENNSGNSSEAIDQYLVSQRIIKNNPSCFSPTIVAEAEQEILRLSKQD